MRQTLVCRTSRTNEAQQFRILATADHPAGDGHETVCSAQPACCWTTASALPRPRGRCSPANSKAKSVIQIWMWGGPAHLDTFDPKPEAGNDYCGPLDKPIATNVSGIRICELLPAAGQAGRQVLPDPQHDPRRQRARNRVLHRADRPHVRRPRCVSQRRRRGLAVQRLQRRIQGADPALYRADRAAGTFLRSRLPGLALQALRHRRRPRAGQLRRGRRGRPGHHRRAPASDRRELPAPAQLARNRPCPAIRTSRPPRKRRTRPTN